MADLTPHPILGLPNPPPGLRPERSTLNEMVATAAGADPGALALLAPGRAPLSHGRLVDVIHRTAATMRSYGLGRQDRIGIAMPDGPETVVLQLAAMEAGVCAPLNPAFNEHEFDFFLQDLRLSAVVVPQNAPSAARAAALKLGLTVLETRVDAASPAGGVELTGNPRSSPAPATEPEPGDLAVLMHTAGTTSRPKIVALTHNNFYAAVRNVCATLRLGPKDRCLSVMPQFHISGICSWMYSLGSGGNIVCAPAFLAPRFFEWMETFQPTWYNVAPTLHQAILERAPQNQAIIKKGRLRFMRSAAAPMSPEIIRRLENAMGAPFIESYGMTEAGSQIASNPLPPGLRKPGSVGFGVGTEIAIIDEHGNFLPPGATGEVVLRGPNVFGGYENNPEANAESFVNGWLRSGDQGHFDSDGYLFLTGRIKELINRGGEKISAREIDEVLLHHPAVAQAAAFAVPDPRLGEDVAAAVVLRTGMDCGESELREFLASRLVSFKVPSQIVFLPDLPKSSSGKVVRVGLAQKLGVTSKGRGPAGRPPFEAPRTPAEISLAAIWRQTLGVEHIGRHEPFLDLGGDSVQAGRIIAQIRIEFGVEMPVLRFFDAPTLSAQAELLRSLPKSDAPGESPASRIPRAPPGDTYPLSAAQRRLAFLHSFEKDDSHYHISLGLNLRGTLDEPALHKSFEAIVARHDALRVVLNLEVDPPTQRMTPPPPVSIARRDFSVLADEPREAALRLWLVGEMNRPFDFSSAPLLRAALGRLGEQEHALVVTMHHIASDNWSLGVLAQELEACYSAFSQGAAPARLPALPVQYQDYAVWQHSRAHGEKAGRGLKYWRNQLKGLPALVEFPGDRPRPAMQTNVGARLAFSTPAGLGARLKEFARREAVTPFVLWLAAFQTLLHRHSGLEDIPVGSPVSNRFGPELEELLGFFVNTLVLRANFSGEPSFRALLAGVKRTALEAFDHQETPFETLVETLNPPRSQSHSPFFQVAFVLLNAPSPPWRLPGLEVESFRPDPGRSIYDLSLLLSERDDQFSGWFEYNTDLYDKSTIERISSQLVTLLDAAILEPERPVARLPLLTAGETRQILVDFNQTTVDYPREKCLHELFEEQVKKSPDDFAVVFERDSLTYRQLDNKANQLARHLRGAGAGVESLVGICVERSLEMVVGLLGILKAGGAYVPLDPEYPKDRLAFMLEDADARVLLTQDRLVELLPPTSAALVRLDKDWPLISAESAAPLESGTAPANAAYMIHTSGSTGRPKGAVNTHEGIVNRLLWMQDAYRLTPADRVLQKTPFSFDVSVWEFFWPLLNGARLVIGRPGGHRDATYLARLIATEGITTVHFVPSMLQVFLEEKNLAPSCAGLKRVICSGEALSVGLQRRFISTLGAGLHNLFGPTEASVDVTHWACERNGDSRTVPIGRPIANTQIYILDRQLQPVPIGVAGELHIGGVGLARGYHRRPGLTAERFIPDPFSPQPGGRLYQTGDLARYRNDGVIEYLGRIDHQIKIRGFRVELGEIETNLRLNPKVREAVVVVREDHPGDQRLISYVVPVDAASSPQPDELRDFLRVRVPDYMVPASFVSLAELPLTPNGKLDRKALPAADFHGSPRDSDHAPPRNPVEEALAGIWAEVLHYDRIGIHDNFFKIGGHSLIATQVVARIRRLFDAEIPLRTLFDHPTVAGLAAQLAALQGGAASEIPPLTRIDRRQNPPLSFAQQRLWFLNRFERTGAVFNTPSAWLLRGDLDRQALESAINAVVQRHESLRTRFAETVDGPVQIIESKARVPLPLEDLGALEGTKKDAAIREAWLRELGESFDLTKGGFVHARLLSMGEREHLLLLMCPHITTDAWSMGVFKRDLAAFYSAFRQNREPNLPELPVQYADYAVWQRAWLRDKLLGRQVDYWRQQLSSAPALELPCDHPRPARQTYAGARQLFCIPARLSAKLAAFNRDQNVTPFMSLLGAFQVLLARYSRQRDFLVGTPIANRQRPELENVVGFFVNTLVIRADLSGEPTFRDVVARVRRTALDAYQHQDLPFEKLVEELNPPRDLGRHPLFQVMFGLENTPATPLQLEGLEVSQPSLPRITTRYDLELELHASEATWTGSVFYNTDLFDQDSIAGMMGHYLALLDSLLAEPDLPVWSANMLAADKRHKILVDWNKTAVAYPRDKRLHELFEEQVEKSPEFVAVVFEDKSLTYRQLNDKAGQLARHLRNLGVRPDSLVGICAERSLEMVVGLLAVLKAGGAYVPLDSEYPQERLAFMVKDSGSEVLLVQDRLAELIPSCAARVVRLNAEWPTLEAVDPAPAGTLVPATSAAYMIYTSGSTGQPKGAVNSHQGIVNRLLWMQDAYRLTPSDRVLQKTPFSFDVSVWEFFWPLLNGARLVMARPGGHRDGAYLAGLIASEGITTLHFVPSMLQVFLEQKVLRLSCASVKRVICSGEALSVALQQRFFASLGAELHNLYGPTEASVDVTAWSCPRDRNDNTVPIGRPIANTRAYILDACLQPVPAGVAGELHIGGVGLARGYHQRADLTGEKFIPDPFSLEAGGRLYKTGDLARYRRDGVIEYLGRLDHQVKLRGFRIELGEIEFSLSRHPSVREALVLAREESPGGQQLVAYVVPSQTEQAPSAADLRDYLRKRLPDYMVPAAVVSLAKFPLMPNGKVDRKALPAPETLHPAVSAARVEPRDEMEKQLAVIWAEILGVPSLGVHDNFFDLGGHSLMVLRLQGILDKMFGSLIPLESIFENPTVAELAVLLRRTGASRPTAPVGETTPPLFFLHFLTVARRLAKHLEQEQKVRAVGSPFDEELREWRETGRVRLTIEELAARDVAILKSLRPSGPYHLIGYCFGGVVAFEAACQLRSQGEQVASLTLIDAVYTPGCPPRRFAPLRRGLEFMAWLSSKDRDWFLFQCKNRIKQTWTRLSGASRSPASPERTPGSLARSHESGEEANEIELFQALILDAYRGRPYEGPTLLFRAVARRWSWGRDRGQANGWDKIITSGLRVEDLPCDHAEIYEEPQVTAIAGILRPHLSQNGPTHY